MPKVKKVTQPVAKAGKKVLATDTAQGVIGAVVDKVEEIAVAKADDAAEVVKDKAATAAGRKKPSGKKSTAKRSGAKKSTAKKSTAKKSARGKKSGAKKSTARSRRASDRVRRSPLPRSRRPSDRVRSPPLGGADTR